MTDARSHYRCEVVCDSVSAYSPRLTTFRIRLPRQVLAQLNTHSLLARSAQSSRAVPTETLIQAAIDRRFVPWEVGSNKKGMQPGEAIEEQEKFQDEWNKLADLSVEYARTFAGMNAHKELANRVLEPFSYVDVVTTATSWTNFFALRTDEEAQKEISFIARAMYLAYRNSAPREVPEGGWHLPFIRTADDVRDALTQHYSEIGANEDNRQLLYPPEAGIGFQAWNLARWSSARCARVSYLLLDKKRNPTPQDDDKTWCKLAGKPIHASAMAHVARSLTKDQLLRGDWKKSHLTGWEQFRKMIPGEHIDTFEPEQSTVDKWRNETPDEVFHGSWV